MVLLGIHYHTPLRRIKGGTTVWLKNGGGRRWKRSFRGWECYFQKKMWGEICRIKPISLVSTDQSATKPPKIWKFWTANNNLGSIMHTRQKYVEFGWDFRARSYPSGLLLFLWNFLSTLIIEMGVSYVWMQIKFYVMNTPWSLLPCSYGYQLQSNTTQIYQKQFGDLEFESSKTSGFISRESASRIRTKGPIQSRRGLGFEPLPRHQRPSCIQPHVYGVGKVKCFYLKSW